jgi:UDP-glucose 4-epimerase
MRCVILGGAGFIGSHLAEALLAMGHQVRIFDRPDRDRIETFSWHGDVEWVEGDFVNPHDTKRALAGQEIVYHLVSTTLPKNSNDNPGYDLDSNVMGSLDMLKLAVSQGIRKVVFVSSGGTVYGLPLQTPIPETHPTDPVCAYGIGKLAIEKYLHLFHVLHGLDYCVLRLSNPFGERQRIPAAQGAVTTFLYRALTNQDIEIWGDGSVVRDYVYIGDAVRALVNALDYAGVERVINIGSGTGRSLNEILTRIEKLLGRPVQRKYVAGRKFDVPVSVLDVARARAALGWYPRMTFEEGLQRTAEWLRRKQS